MQLMKVNTLTLFFLFMSSIIAAQVSYKSGYIIDDSGNKIECFIKDLEWTNNPTEFQYKLSEDSKDIKTGTLNSINTFVINNHTKFLKVIIDIDRSKNKLATMSKQFEPDFVTETLFLKTILEGAANLYEFQDNEIQRFFYSTKDNKIEQLVFKKFLLNSNSISTNESYKKQLYDNLKCETISVNDSRSLQYSQRSLVNFFQKYNTCSNTVSNMFTGLQKKGKLGFSAKVGYSNASLEVDYNVGSLGNDRRSLRLDSKPSIRIGAEIEYVLPFNNNTWAIFVEPGFQSYKSSKSLNVQSAGTPGQTFTLDYQYIDVPFGLRHYRYLNDNSKLFVSAALVFVFDLGENFIYEDHRTTYFDINSSLNFNFGIGFNYLDKFSIEARLSTPRDIVDYGSFSASYKTSLGLVLGYKFL
jgi:hypothetical protein